MSITTSALTEFPKLRSSGLKTEKNSKPETESQSKQQTRGKFPAPCPLNILEWKTSDRLDIIADVQ